MKRFLRVEYLAVLLLFMIWAQLGGLTSVREVIFETRMYFQSIGKKNEEPLPMSEKDQAFIDEFQKHYYRDASSPR